MKASTYKTIRKIHLYASLPIVALLLMYVVSSYFMIHYQKFNTYHRNESVKLIQVSPDQVSDGNWSSFLQENGVSGKLTNENTSTEGHVVRKYSRAGREYEVTIYASKNSVEIKKQ